MSSNHPTGQPRQTPGTSPDRDDQPHPPPPAQTNYPHPPPPPHPPPHASARPASPPTPRQPPPPTPPRPPPPPTGGEATVPTHTARTPARDPPAAQRPRLKAPNDPDAPGQVEPSGSAGAAARETSDPNYTAASRPRDDRTATSSMNPNASPAPNRQHGRHAHPTHVRDLMSTNLEVATPTTDLYFVARMMAERDIGAIPVVDSTDTMHPVGILTDRDIVVRVIAKNQGPDELNAGQVMTPSVTTVRPETSIDDA